MLAEVVTMTPPAVQVDALRRALDDAAVAAADGVEPGRLPLRLPKDRMAKLLACEQLAMSSLGGAALSEPVVRGRILDRLLHHHLHAAPSTSAPALAVAEGAFAAERDDEVLEWLRADPPTRGRLAEDASAFAERLHALGGVDRRWWPRCEERVRVDLAGGAVVCSAQLDLVLGGPPTELPLVVVEVKSGRLVGEHRDGLRWYALLVALRYGTAPAAIACWSALDGNGWVDAVTEASLTAALDRAGDALDRLGTLARGATPARTPGRACTWCPEASTCPVAAADDDG
jgi:RecB family exonuclease